MPVPMNPNRAVASRPQPAKPNGPTVTPQIVVPEMAARRPVHTSSVRGAETPQDVSDPSSQYYDPSSDLYDPQLDPSSDVNT